MDLLQASEWLWQAHLAGHDEEYPRHLQTALLCIDQQQLLSAADQLVNATGGWLCLVNRLSPSLPWQADG